MGIFFYALLLLVVVALLYGLIAHQRTRQRGVTLGAPPQVNHASVVPWGTNVALEHYLRAGQLDRSLDALDDLGMVWLRQRLPWQQVEPEPGRYVWTPWDQVIEAAASRGFRLVLVLDGSPAWARTAEDQAEPLAPPANPHDFARFAGAVARRYGDLVDVYQLWDEPNIRPHWGAERLIDPSGYATLLASATPAIRAADKSAIVLTAGLAPNQEAGGYNMSEIKFLQGLYEAGAAPYFDVVALKAFGFWTGPEDRRASESVLNWSRLLLARELMVAHDDAQSAIWTTGGGWASLPAGWQGMAAPWGSDGAEIQSARLAAAVARAQTEWPWLGAMILMELHPAAPSSNPLWGLALYDQEWKLTDSGATLRRLANRWVPGPGHWPSDGPGTAIADERRIFEFVGTNVTLVLSGANAPTQLLVDGAPLQGVVEYSHNNGHLTLPRLAPGRHTIELWPADTVRGFIVSHQQTFLPFYATVLTLILLSAGLAGRLVWLGWTLPWAYFYDRWSDLPDSGQTAFAALLIFAFALVPNVWLSLAFAFALWLIFIARLDLGLAAIAIVLPFFLRTKVLLDLRFSLPELLTLLCAAAWGWRVLWRAAVTVRSRRLDVLHAIVVRAFWPRDALDWSVLLFLLVSALSPLWAYKFGVAAREFRVVVLEPVILYWLVRRYTVAVTDGNRGDIAGPTEESERDKYTRLAHSLVSALILGALILALYSLFQWLFTPNIIRAEGVRRALGPYGSPNNLALYLGRVVPIVVALVLLPPSAAGLWTRRLAAVALGPVVIALFLTFSRGAWLLGIPAALLYVAWRGPHRVRLPVLIGLMVAIVALAPFAATERIRSILTTQDGTWFIRLSLWRSTVDMLTDNLNWIRGVGLDNFLYLYPAYMRPEAWREPHLSHPHNILLHYWVALGLLGLGVLFWKQLAFWRAAQRAWHNRGVATAPLVLGLSASMADFLAHGLIDNSYFLVDLAFVFMLTAGLVAEFAGVTGNGQNDETTRRNDDGGPGRES